MKTIVSTLILALSLSAKGQTQNFFSIPSGYVKHDLSVGFNPIGINLHGSVVASGTIDARDGNIFSENNADLSTLLTDASATYLLEITNRRQFGAVAEITSVTSGANNTSTFQIEGTGMNTGNATYNIRKALTLNELFGTGTQAQLTGGRTSNSADIVWLQDETGGYTQYFYSTSTTGTDTETGQEFRSTNTPFVSPDKPITVFYPDGLYIQVKDVAKTVTVFGQVKNTSTIVSGNTGLNLVSIPSPTGVTLDGSRLSEGVSGANSTANADIVWIPNDTGGYDQYFFHSGASVWRSFNTPFTGNEGATILPSTVFIQRKSRNTAFRIYIPTFYSNL